MSVPVMTRSNYSHLFGTSKLPVLEEIFKYELSMHQSVRDRIFRTESTSTDIYQSSELHDLPLFTATGEGSQYDFNAAKQGASKTFIVTKYGSGFSISEEMVDDGKMSIIGDLTRMLAKSAKESQEVQGMNVLNNGFSSETTADGVALFSTAHTNPSGGTFRNKASTDLDLSESALQDAVSDFKTQFVGDSGIIYNISPRFLLVHSSQGNYARELVGSSQKPDSADNNLNSLRSSGLEVLESPHLTDTDSWFVIGDPSRGNGLRVIKRQGLMTKAATGDAGFFTDSIYYKAKYREKVGAVNAVGIWGSSGA